MAAARAFLLLCLSLVLFQSFARENFVSVSSKNDRAENPEWRVFWHQHPPLRPRVHHPPLHLPHLGAGNSAHPPLPSHHHKHSHHKTFTSEKSEAKNPNGSPAGGMPTWPKTKWTFPHPPLPSWLPKNRWSFPHPPLPSWLPKTKLPFPHPPLPSWLPKTKQPFPHPPLPSWLPKNKWHFPVLPPLPSGGCKWPWLPHGPHHSSKTLEDNKALETKCHSTPAVVESCMKKGTFSFSDTSGYTFSTECCKSVAEIKDECSDELYVPVIKYQCFTHA